MKLNWIESIVIDYFNLFNDLILINELFNTVTNAICDKAPDKSVTRQPKQSGNGGFAIGIVGSPSHYRPGQQYEITLEVFKSNK